MGDYRTTTGEAKPLPEAQRRLRRRRLALGVAGGVLTLVAAGFAVRVPRIVTATGYVTTEDHAEVRPPSAGIVTQVLFRSGDSAQQGDLLAQLDDAEQAAALDEARSLWRKAEAELSRREAEIAQQRKDLEDRTAIARLKKQNAEAKLHRAEELRNRGLAAESAVEDVRLQLEVAAAELESLAARDLSLFDRELAVTRHEAESQRERVTRAEALVSQRQIRAPIAGQVLRYEFAVGELVRTDMVLFELFGGARKVLKLRIDERHAALVAPGQPYRARLTTFGGWPRPWFEGTVESLRNVIQLEGQKTYRTAYCQFEAGGRQVPPGASAEAQVRTGRIPLWAHLFGVY